MLLLSYDRPRDAYLVLEKGSEEAYLNRSLGDMPAVGTVCEQR